MVKIFEKLPAGMPLTFNDIMQAENQIIKAIKHSLVAGMADRGRPSSRQTAIGIVCSSPASPSRFAQHLGMREEDQRRLTRAALLHDVGKAFIPVAILDKPGTLTDEEMAVMRKHPRLGYEALAAQGGFPPEMLDVVLHHHEFLDGSGYPDGLRGDQISDIVRLMTIVDIHAAMVEKRAYRLPFTHIKAFAIMEQMGDKLDQHLLQVFRPVALGTVLSGAPDGAVRSPAFASGRLALVGRDLDQAAVRIAAIHRPQRAARALPGVRALLDRHAARPEMRDHLSGVLAVRKHRSSLPAASWSAVNHSHLVGVERPHIDLLLCRTAARFAAACRRRDRTP